MSLIDFEYSDFWVQGNSESSTKERINESWDSQKGSECSNSVKILCDKRVEPPRSRGLDINQCHSEVDPLTEMQMNSLSRLSSGLVSTWILYLLEEVVLRIYWEPELLPTMFSGLSLQNDDLFCAVVNCHFRPIYAVTPTYWDPIYNGSETTAPQSECAKKLIDNVRFFSC